MAALVAAIFSLVQEPRLLWPPRDKSLSALVIQAAPTIGMIKIPQQIAILLLACITVLAQLPDTAANHVQAGLAAQRAGQCEQALREYAIALQLDPKNFGAQFNSGSCYVVLQR